MKRFCLAVALGCSALAFAAPPVLAAAPATYADASRDAGGRAPELTTVVVSNDDAGTIRFRINVANQPRLRAGSTLELYVDSDRNPATGDPLSLGADHRFVLDGATQTFDFARWTETGFDSSAPSSTVRVWYWSGVSITIDRSELGGTSGLSFWIRSRGVDGTNDVAPDHGSWSYDLGTGVGNPPDVEAFSFRVRPAAPRAGATWRLEVDAVRLAGGGGTARPDRWTCTATLARRPLRGTGRGGCTFRLARGSRGKRLEITITVTYRGEVVSGVTAYLVR